MIFTFCFCTLLSSIISRKATAELTPLKLAIVKRTKGRGQNGGPMEGFSGSKNDHDAMVTTKGKVTDAV